MRLKTNKTFTKRQRKKLKIKKIRIKSELINEILTTKIIKL